MKNIRGGYLIASSLFLVALIYAAVHFGGIWGCGGSGSKSCNRFTQTGCDSGLVCELTQGDKTDCFKPVVVQGNVSNSADGSVVAGARVIALDINGSPVSNVATTDSSGNYELTVFVTRASDGIPATEDFTLRADAAGFMTFPSGLQQPIPVNTSIATAEDNKFVITSSLTNLRLIPVETGTGTASIHGKVELPENSLGALVVAESSSTTGFNAIADRSGDYKIFNLSAGDYTVRGYVKDANYTPVNITLTGSPDAEVNLSLNSDPTATFNGSVQIVNPTGGSVTSVILVVESTFNENIIRGAMPPGLRAPPPPDLPNITGSFTITGIPAGSYVALAAFENDGLVRDPDTCIGGTLIFKPSFVAGETVDMSQGFKITGALAVISPGADLPEGISTTTRTFKWEDDSSEDNYDIVVFDSFGNKIWETSIPGVSSGTPEVTYAGPALETGLYYQFRATSTKASGRPCAVSGKEELSQTEDLKGVFYVQ